MAHLEEKHRQDLNHQQSDHKHMTERHAAEQLSIREDLRKELAKVHIEKFSAMAAELSHVHKVRRKDGCSVSVLHLVNSYCIVIQQKNTDN